MKNQRWMSGLSSPRRAIAIILSVSLLLMIGCTSLTPIIQEEKSITRTAEKLAASADFVVKMKNGESHRFMGEGARILDDEGKQWIRGNGIQIALEDVESILTDRDLLIRIRQNAEVEFSAGRWSFLVREGSMDSITGAGVKTDNTTGEEQSGIFSVALSDVTDMSVWEADTLATIGLVAGIGLAAIVVAGAVALSSMDFNLNFGFGK
ncbi:MAG: hypothetical protein WEB33_04655 [Bacteroidota bacterium]